MITKKEPGLRRLTKEEKFDYSKKPADEPGYYWGFTNSKGWTRRKIIYNPEEKAISKTAKDWRAKQADFMQRTEKAENEVKDTRTQLE